MTSQLRHVEMTVRVDPAGIESLAPATKAALSQARVGLDGLRVPDAVQLETTRGYTRPSAEDRTRALDLLLVDQ